MLFVELLVRDCITLAAVRSASGVLVLDFITSYFAVLVYVLFAPQVPDCFVFLLDLHRADPFVAAIGDVLCAALVLAPDWPGTFTGRVYDLFWFLTFAVFAQRCLSVTRKILCYFIASAGVS